LTICKAIKTTLARATFPRKPYANLEDPDIRDFAERGAAVRRRGRVRARNCCGAGCIRRSSTSAFRPAPGTPPADLRLARKRVKEVKREN
jgi:hypothetical protein